MLESSQCVKYVAYARQYIRVPCAANRVNRPNERKKGKTNPKIIYSCGVTRTVHKYCHLVDQLLIDFCVHIVKCVCACALECFVCVRVCLCVRE